MTFQVRGLEMEKDLACRNGGTQSHWDQLHSTCRIPLNATVTYVKKDQYIHILLFCVTKFIPWTKSLSLTKRGDLRHAADYTAEILYAKAESAKWVLQVLQKKQTFQLLPSPLITITVLLHQQWTTTGHYCCVFCKIRRTITPKATTTFLPFGE